MEKTDTRWRKLRQLYFCRLLAFGLRWVNRRAGFYIGGDWEWGPEVGMADGWGLRCTLLVFRWKMSACGRSVRIVFQHQLAIYQLNRLLR